MLQHHCSTCACSFTRKARYVAHLKTQLHKRRVELGKNMLPCKECGRLFLNESSLYQHSRKCKGKPDLEIESLNVIGVKNEEKNKLPCQECGHVGSCKGKPALEEEVQRLKDQLSNKNATIDELKTKLKTLETTNTQHVVVKHGRQKIPLKTRELIRNKQENKCKQCTHELTPYFHLDHEVAMRFGGNHDIDNLQALCAECHTRKSTLESKYNMRIKAAIKDILNSHDL